MKYAVIFFAFLILQVNAQALELRAGAAKVSLNPPAGISLAGFGGGNRRYWSFWKKQNAYAHWLKASTSVHDEVFAKTAFLEFGDEKLVIIGLDLVASTADFRQDLATRLAPLGVTAKSIILTATHTHSGPGDVSHTELWQLLATDKFVPEVYNTFVDAIAQSVIQAHGQLRPAEIDIDLFRLENAIANRRDLPDLDPVGTLIRIDAMDGSPIATVVNFPIHGTVLGTSNLQISADIPGAIANELEKRTGGIVVYVNGAEGDVNPIVVSNDFSGLQTAAIGHAENIFAAWKTLKPHRPLKFKSVEETVHLGAPKLNAFACVEIRNKSGDWLIPIEALGLPRSASLSAFNIDDHLFITIPGEPVTRFGLQMKALGQAAHFKTTSIFGLTNDYIGYILTSDEYRLGLYESCSSFYGPELGGFMTQGVQTLVQQINPTDGSVNREEPKTLEPIK